VPQNIAEILDPVALAFWCIGDGSKTGPGFHLCTTSFSRAENQLLVDAIKSKFDLNCTIHSNNRIYIPSKEMAKFRTLVEPHFLTEFKYKLR